MCAPASAPRIAPATLTPEGVWPQSAHRYALTAQRGGVLGALVQPVRARCHDLLAEAGDRGRMVRNTANVWLGHGTGLFPKVEPVEPR